MAEILQSTLPADMLEPRALPGVQPVEGSWIHVDEAYARQMALRRSLITTRLNDVYQAMPEAQEACHEVLEEVTAMLPALGFEVNGDFIRCPDGAEVRLDGPPLVVLGQLVQADICVLQKSGAAHSLSAACLCFPAGWHLHDKVGHPLVRIHAPVDSYDADVAARVQRLFDGVQVGRPLWRFNRLTYADPDLHQPRREGDPRPVPVPGQALYIRSERQSIVRMPRTQAVVFAIHTYVVRASSV